MIKNRMPLTGNFTLVVFSCILVLLAVSGCKKSSGQIPAPDQKPSATIDPKVKVDQYWANAKEEVDKSVLELLAQHQVELERGLSYHKFMRGDSTKNQIALTFDDGPHPAFTPQLLDVLKKNDVKATFFLVGEMAEKAPDLVKREIAEGHSVGNHTYHHVNLTKIPKEDVATEIKACSDVLTKITGKAPHLFRPPGGDYNRQVIEVAEAEGYTTIFWTDDPGDYASPGKKIIEVRLLRNVNNGGIILIHDGVQETVDILPKVIEYMKNRGFEFVTIDEMLAKK
jgi:peptidoglycan-N-acetylglucosamine deacetylase